MMKILHKNVFKSLDYVGFQCPYCGQKHCFEKRYNWYDTQKSQESLELHCTEFNVSAQILIVNQGNCKFKITIPGLCGRWYELKVETSIFGTCGCFDTLTFDVNNKNFMLCVMNQDAIYSAIQKFQKYEDVGCDKQYYDRKCKGTENCWYARINRNDQNQYDDYRGMVPLEVFLYAEKSAEYEQIKDETLIKLEVEALKKEIAEHQKTIERLKRFL